MSIIKKIVYHGTNKEAADIILKEGFKEWSYFAINLDDALAFGGPYIFRVVLSIHKDNKNWQPRNREAIGVDKIVELRHYDEHEVLYENDEASKDVAKEANERNEKSNERARRNLENKNNAIYILDRMFEDIEPIISINLEQIKTNCKDLNNEVKKNFDSYCDYFSSQMKNYKEWDKRWWEKNR